MGLETRGGMLRQIQIPSFPARTGKWGAMGQRHERGKRARRVIGVNNVTISSVHTLHLTGRLDALGVCTADLVSENIMFSTLSIAKPGHSIIEPTLSIY